MTTPARYLLEVKPANPSAAGPFSILLKYFYYPVFRVSVFKDMAFGSEILRTCLAPTFGFYVSYLTKVLPLTKLFFLSEDEWKVCVLVRMFMADLWAELAASLSRVFPIFVFFVTWGAFENILFLFLDSLIFDAPKISESYFCVFCFC